MGELWIQEMIDSFGNFAIGFFGFFWDLVRSWFGI